MKNRFFSITHFAFCAVVSATLVCGCATGNIRRTAYITSTPAGAQCRINGAYYGKTPVEFAYLWNWYYDIKLEKPGYQILEDKKKFRAGIQNTFPFDFVMEVLPFRTYERKRLDYTLTPGN